MSNSQADLKGSAIRSCRRAVAVNERLFLRCSVVAIAITVALSLLLLVRLHGWREPEDVDIAEATTGRGDTNRTVTLPSDLLFGGVATRANVESVGALLALSPTTVTFCHPDLYSVRAAAYNFDATILEVPGVLNTGRFKASGVFR